MKIDILTLFTEMCDRVLCESIIGRARAKGIIETHCHNIRDYTENKQKQVDDAPFGGGMGMIVQAQPIYDCFKAVEASGNGQKPYVIYMSPQGKTLTQKKALELSKKPWLVLVCGHYEGVDERVIEEIVDEEVSIGDYVLTGGELPALVLADTVARLVPGVLSSEECFTEESHFSGLLEYPQYSRPRVWNGREVPEVLFSGHHLNIKKWRRQKSLERTFFKRPEMLENAELSKDDLEYIARLKAENDK